MKKIFNKIVILALFSAGFSCCALGADVKDADLAGSWYPSSGAALSSLIEGYLKRANPENVEGQIFAIISPHAGYQFSGAVAAYGFKIVRNRAVKTVIIIGFNHRKSFNGIAIYDRGSWRTPLGEIRIDNELAGAIASKNPRIRFEPGLFAGENSVELQVPFIQMAIKDAKIVPIAFGVQNYEDAQILADAIASAIGNRTDILIVASTDMSHYHPYEDANSMDARTINLVKDLKAKELYDECALGISELCGVMPVAASILAAEKLGYDKVKMLKYANSGDTFGDKTRVVGYMSAVIYKTSAQPPEADTRRQDDKRKESAMLNDAQRKRLLQIARESIASYVKDGKRKRFTENDPVLNKPMGAFVTLHEAGELRGCIGNMAGSQPLYQTVADMAVEAATGDPRFPALSPAQVDRIDIEISALSPLKRIASPDEVKIPGHGVLVRRGFRSGVYLPQVATEAGWNKEEFMTSLCGQKAGLSPDAWKDPSTEIYVFTAEVFGEKGGE